MSGKIVRLSETVINQIAAGEVVESPASVIKELIENSLDAGARSISVVFTPDRIQIEDDGSGMNREDAILCLERHATSKLRQIEDLDLLATMGFRGEALAAIASVSRLEIKTSDGKESTRVFEGRIEPCARNRGTTLEVRDLFFNTPARKKFQKSHTANAAAVRRVIETLALAHPEVRFALADKFDHKPAASEKERIEEILGAQEHEVFLEKGDLRIRGFLSAPQGNRTGQHFYLNRRPIFSPLISRAVKQGFGTRLAEKEHPSFVLFLDIPPDAVDVNVHPQKKEARFKEEGRVFRFVEEAVSNAFRSVSLPESIHFEPPPIQWSFRDEEVPVQAPRHSVQLDLSLSVSDKPVAIQGNYLWIQRDEMWLIDIQAAQARVLFESLSQKTTSQALLFPQTVDLSRDEALHAEEWIEKLHQIGIECRLLGEKTLLIDALPSGLDDFSGFFEQWKTGADLRAVASRFCKGKKGSLSMAEAMLIWQQLQRCSDTRYDPLGHPIWVVVTEELCGKWIRD